MHAFHLPLYVLFSTYRKRCCVHEIRRRTKDVVGLLTLTTATLSVGLLFFSSVCTAQHVFYNQKQDKTAQDAVIAGKEITSGAEFDKMLHNLDSQATQESNTVLAFTREQMRASLAAMDAWHAAGQVSLDPRDTVGPLLCKKYVRCTVELIRNRLNAGSILLSPIDQAESAEQVSAIEAKSAELKKAVEQLQTASKTKDPAVLELLSHLGDAKDLVGYGKQIQSLAGSAALSKTGNAGLGSALNEISKGLDELISLYNITKGIWDGYAAVNVDISSLRPSREAIQIKALALEEEHLKALSRIRANEALEAGDQLATIQEAIGRLQEAKLWDSNERITTTLQLAAEQDSAATPQDPTRLREVLDALMDVTAVIVPSDATVRLNSIRVSDEDRRYSLRLSALNTSTYDMTVQNALQRLALYYKGGMKPTDLAQLIFFISSSVSVPVIAAK